jgi:hypothetical protein
MTTIVIEQAEVRLTPQQLVTALQQLSPDELENVFRQLELPSWQARLDALLERVRQRAIQNPISDDEIDAEVNTARNEFYSSRS